MELSVKSGRKKAQSKCISNTVPERGVQSAASELLSAHPAVCQGALADIISSSHRASHSAIILQLGCSRQCSEPQPRVTPALLVVPRATVEEPHSLLLPSQWGGGGACRLLLQGYGALFMEV